MGKIITTFTNKKVKVEKLCYCTTKNFDKIKDNKAVELLQKYGYKFAYVVYAIINGDERGILVNREEYYRCKSLIKEESKDFIQKALTKSARAMDIQDDRVFRKGLNFDWRA